MRKLTYHGPGHRLNLPSGRTVARGETGEVTNADAESAQDNPHIDVTVTDVDDQRVGADASDDDEPEAGDGEGPTEQQEV